MTYQAEQWPHGLRCAACDRRFVEGQPICKRLEGMDMLDDEPMPVVLIVCADCDITGRQADNKDSA